MQQTPNHDMEQQSVETTPLIYTSYQVPSISNNNRSSSNNNNNNNNSKKSPSPRHFSMSGDESSSSVSLLLATTNNNRPAVDDQNSSSTTMSPFLRFFQNMSNHWIPVAWEEPLSNATTTTTNPQLQQQQQQHHEHKQHYKQHPQQQQQRIIYYPRRSIQRRIFLILTEPDSSIASAIFFGILVIAISLMNIVMMMQTMEAWQFTPTDCRTCGGPISYLFDDDDSIVEPPKQADIECVCPPTPLPWTVTFLNWSIYCFSVEWILRVLTFELPQNEQSRTVWGRFGQWMSFMTSTTTVLDFLAIFPYYAELSFQTNGLMSLRLLRLFRVFQLVRLGQYNENFMSLTTVLVKSIPYLKLLLGVLIFGAAFFGSMMYWLEKGDWKYFQDTDSYQFVRINEYGQEEISPFSSIPASFWWFFVTATTVGYGDTFPTSTGGKWVATFAMLTGVLVIAFPVSVFSDLWQSELRKGGALSDLLATLDDNNNNNNDDDNNNTDDDDDDGNDVKELNASSSQQVSTLASTVQLPQNVMSPIPRIEVMQKEAAAVVMGQDSDHSHLHVPELAGARSKPSVATPPQQTTKGPAAMTNRATAAAAAAALDQRHHHVESNLVVMRKDDLLELAAHMQSIHESQKHIRHILRRYRIPLQHNTMSSFSDHGGSGSQS